MIEMTQKQKKLMDELKKVNAETFYHSLHVKTLTSKLLNLTNEDGFTNYTPQEIDTICKGALLHDLGKIYIKNAVLTKDSPLTDEEKEHMTQHAQLSYDAIKAELGEDEAEIIKNICLYHHERIDGSGYMGITQLPIYLQIVSVCDVFDALHSDRIYRQGLSYNKTMQTIESGGSGKFDETIIDYLKKATKALDE
ncbi:MAG: HD domain-containing protein [Clostridia bacterium]|nr:HD domain-containing protein [Clostridia bacterium]